MSKNRRDLQLALLDARQQLKSTQLRIAELEVQLAQSDAGIEASPVSIERDITYSSTMKTPSQRNQVDFLPRLLETTHGSQDFDGVLTATLRLICQYTACDYGEIWVPNAAKTALVCSPLHYIAAASIDQLHEFRLETEKLSFKRGEGIPGKIWEFSTVEWIPDLCELDETQFRRYAVGKLADLHNIIGVPILIDGQVAAVLCLMAHKIRENNPRIMQLISATAGQMRSLMQRQQSDLELKRYVQQMELLHQIALGLIHGDSIRGLIGTTLKYLRRLIPCQRAMVSVLDPLTNEGLVFSLDLRHETELGEGVHVGALAFEFEGLDSRYSRVIDAMDKSLTNSETHDEMRSCLQVLLMHQQHPIGALELLAASADFFVPAYQDIAVQIAGQLAVAVHQIRLTNQLQQRLTDINQAHEIRRQSEARYRSVVNDQTDLICRYNTDFHLTFVNAAYQQFHNKTEQELLGTDLLDLIPADQRQQARESVLALTAANPVSTNEHQSILPDGSRRWMQWTDRALVDNTGKIVEYQGVGRDITDRIALQVAQQQHTEDVEAMQKFLQSTLDSFPANAAVLANDGTILNVNAPWRRFAEENAYQSVDHFVGDNYLDVCNRVTGTDEDEAVSAADGIRAVIAGEVDEFYLEYACHSPTSQRWFRMGVTPFNEIAPRRVVVAHIDITMRKLAEMALQEAHDTLEQRVNKRTAELNEEKGRIEAILDNSFDGIVLVNSALGLQRTNRAFDRLFLYDLLASPQQALPDLIAPDDRDRVRVIMKGVATVQQDQQFEVLALRTNGSTFEAEISVGHITQDGLVCTIRDITERNRSQAVLAEERNLLRTLIDSAPDYIYIKDPQHRFVLSNLALAQARGKTTPEELVGTTDFEYFPPELAASFHADEDEILRTGKPQIDYEQPSQGYTGGFQWASSNKVPLRNLKGEMRGIVGITRDITERKAQERQLRYHASLQENMNDGVISTDMDFRIQSWNHGAEVIYGWRAEEVIGKTIPEVLRTRMEGEASRSAVMQALTERGKWRGELVQFRKDDTEVYAMVSLNLLRDEHNQPIGTVGVNVDITERKKAEQALQVKMAEERVFHAYSKSLHEVTFELTQITDINAFYRRAVELGLERLGFERLALFLYDEEHHRAIGTYGTDIHGNVTDERHVSFTPVPNGVAMRALQRDERFAFEEVAVLTTALAPVGNGWRVSAVLWNGKNALGWLFADNAISHAPASKAVLDILSLYALTLGGMLGQMHVQAHLRESESRYRLLAENATDVITRVTPELRYTYVAPSVRAVLGYEPDELIGQIWSQFGHPDELNDANKFQQLMRTRSTDSILRVESRFRHKQGHYVWLESLIKVIRNEATGELEGSISSSRDITGRKQAEAALRDSEEKFRMLMQAGPIAVIISDQTGTIILANQQAEHTFGYSQDELIGQPIELLIPDRAHKQHSQHRRNYLDAPRMRRMGAGLELYAKRKDNSEFPVEIELSFVKTDNNVMVMSFIMDITERKQTAAELDRQRAFLREVIDVSPNMIFVKDYDAKFILVNPMVAKTYNTTVEALIGKSDADFNSSETEIEAFLASDRRVIDSGETIHIDEPVTDALGVTRWFHTTKVPIISSDGASKYVLGVSTDITERRGIEDTLRQSIQKEKELGDLKTRFVSMASHEFRTPLATILALTDTVIAYRDRLSDEQIGQRLSKIQSQVWHLRDIIEDVLQLSRIQARRVEFNPVRLDLDSLCRSVVDEFTSRPDFTHQIAYRCDIELHEVKLDRRLMRQVISNLVSNAIKYSPNGKTVSLQLSMVDEMLGLIVQDEGIGIPAADLKYLFEPFHRGANVGTIPGTGLGLVITKESIELHGGMISVTSEVNVGTTFTVRIPINSDGASEQ